MDDPQAHIKKLSRRSLLWSAGAIAAGCSGLRWLTNSNSDGIPSVLRAGLRFNENLGESLFGPARESKQFPDSEIQPLRINGDEGLKSEIPKDWTLKIVAPNKAIEFSLQEIMAMPKYNMVTQLRCVEGWSRINHWGGARLSELLSNYAATTDFDFVGMETPDGEYYVGLDRDSVMHSQTLLCYEMNHAPLTIEHGAPLRLALPVKYGYKQLKRIGTITLTNERPRDFWAEEGYDWYAGL